MPHPYPPHHPNLPYTRQHYYFLTFCTDRRQPRFADADVVDLVLTQFLRAAAERRFEITAYCFMPDHSHLLVRGLDDHSDCKAFIRASKQYSGYRYSQQKKHRLWQRYAFERVVRDDMEVVCVMCYIITNPLRSGLVEQISHYSHVGSLRYTVEEMVKICSELDPECFRLKPEATRPEATRPEATRPEGEAPTASG